MAYSNPLAAKRVTIDNVNWTPITVPFNCDYCVVTNLDSGDVKFRTDPADPTTEGTMNTLAQKIISAPVSASVISKRFETTDTVFYAKSVSGTGPLLAEFLRL